MRKILIYSHSEENFIGETYRSLAKGFEECGYETLVINVDEQNYLEKLESAFQNEDIYFSLGHNEYGINLDLQNGSALYETINIPHVSLLDDAPYNAVTFQVKDARCNNLILGVRDRSHLKCLPMDSYQSRIRSSFFLPFSASIEPDIKNLNSNKDIDVLYSAIYYGNPHRVWRELNLGTGLINLLDEVADCLECTAISVYDAFSYSNFAVVKRSINS